jgi:hypothetical protein
MKRVPIMLCSALLLAVTAGPVAAAPPGNDLPSGATVVPLPLPFTDIVDTSEATVTTDDVGCGAGGWDQASVWYSITPDTDIRVAIDASASSYATGLNLFVATPTNLVACTWSTLVWNLEAGTTYYVMAADIDDDGVNGGTLEVTFDVGPPPLELSVTIAPTAKVDSKSGTVTVSGTLTCSMDTPHVEQLVIVRQTVGRFTIRGGSWDIASCDEGGPVAWTATLTGENGTFGGGRASVEVSVFGCSWSECTEAFASRSVSLRR